MEGKVEKMEGKEEEEKNHSEPFLRISCRAMLLYKSANYKGENKSHEIHKSHQYTCSMKFG